MRKQWVAAWFALALGGSHGSAKSPQVLPQPAKPNMLLVELFTSEGCSSCPPADDLLRSIDGRKTDQGTLIVGISEHVTYWDHDGWKDPYDSEAITERQNEYGRKFNLESVYTPQMVVNGETQFVGSDARSLEQAVSKMPGEPGAAVKIGSVTLDGASVTAQVAIGAIPSKGAEIYAAVAEDETTQRVLRGENEGKTLAHASVARVMVKVAKVRAAGTTGLRLKLPNDAAATAGSKRHLIVWAQEPNLGRVLAVDTQAF